MNYELNYSSLKYYPSVLMAWLIFLNAFGLVDHAESIGYVYYELQLWLSGGA